MATFNARAAGLAFDREVARLITGISAETRQAIRAIIVRSIESGIPPFDAARMIRPLIGLNEPQMLAAVNYRTGLINAGHTLERVDTLMARYAKRKIRERAETISRTEIMGALNRGSREAWDQAQRSGLLTRNARRTAVTTPDERRSDICLDVAARVEVIPLNGVYHTINGVFSGPPFHVRCRTTERVIP